MAQDGCLHDTTGARWSLGTHPLRATERKIFLIAVDPQRTGPRLHGEPKVQHRSQRVDRLRGTELPCGLPQLLLAGREGSALGWLRQPLLAGSGIRAEVGHLTLDDTVHVVWILCDLLHHLFGLFFEERRIEFSDFDFTLLSGETVLCLCCQEHVVAHRFSLLMSAVAQNAFW